MENIPQSFYYVIGGLVVTNFASLVALITFIFKAGMFVADTKSGIKDAKASSVRAHVRIDKIEEKV